MFRSNDIVCDMGLEQFAKNVKKSVDTALAEREKRFRDPTFQAELALERKKFTDSLNTMGERGLETAHALLLKAPLTTMWRSLQAASGAKKNRRQQYSFDDVVLDSLKEYGKAGWKATKFAASTLVAGGRGAKLGMRYLIAK